MTAVALDRADRMTLMRESPMESIKLDLPALLPDISTTDDQCVDRLESLLVLREGITKVHIITNADDPARLCLHYDENIISLTQVEHFARSAGVELTVRYGHAVIAFPTVDSRDENRLIEQQIRDLPGVVTASFDPDAQVAQVEFDRYQASWSTISSELHRKGYLPAPQSADPPVTASSNHNHDAPDSWIARNKELTWSLTGGVLLLVAWVGERWLGLPGTAAIALFAASYVFGAWDLVHHTWEHVRQRQFTFSVDLLMLLAAAGAAFLGQWAEGAFLLFLFSLAHALEHYAMDRARHAISALADLAPPMARVRRDGQEREVAIADVVPGDLVMVRPGERIAVDGNVQSGQSAVNQAPVTGESVPVEKRAGSQVFAGTVNGDGALEVVTTAAVGDRTLDRVIKLVEEAQTQKAPTEQFVERFSRFYVPAVLVADVAVIVLPPLLGFWDWQTSIYRGMALLVAASPCALALGTPAAILTGIAQAARRGVLIKGGAYLENLGSVRAIAFDKTGTLTEGRPEVTDVEPFGEVTANELLTIAAAVERTSQHPLAEAVVRRAEREQLALPAAGALQSISGQGVRSDVDGQSVEIGNLRLWEEAGAHIPDAVRQAVQRLHQQGRSVMVVRQGEQWLGALGLADQPRAGVASVLAELRSLGIRPLIMLTGDNQGVGDVIGREVGVDEVMADLLPEDKLTAIKSLEAQYGAVAMVGDGVNDAPALAHATVGIAMGGAGTAVALETADVALMGDDIGRLPFVVSLSREARRIIFQNVALAMGAVVILIVATVTGFIGIGLAVVIHEGSTLVVLANALRLLGFNGSGGRGSDTR